MIFLRRWGGIASFFLCLCFLAPAWAGQEPTPRASSSAVVTSSSVDKKLQKISKKTKQDGSQRQQQKTSPQGTAGPSLRWLETLPWFYLVGNVYGLAGLVLAIFFWIDWLVLAGIGILFLLVLLGHWLFRRGKIARSFRGKRVFLSIMQGLALALVLAALAYFDLLWFFLFFL